jgi:hypothetical protein
MKKLFILAALVCFAMIGCTSQPHYQMKGLVLETDDIATVDWAKIAHENGINTIGTHKKPGTKFPCREVMDFMLSERGQEFLSQCKARGIDVEHQLHAMKELLPRELYAEDPTMFRMDENGNRVADANCCVHSERALEIITKNAVDMAKVLRPTNHRYYFWLDDGKPVCQCPECREYSAGEQALILENRLIVALRELDPEAQLAHLAYHNAVEAPRKVKPAEGIFLEFAPYFRVWDQPLTNPDVGRRGMNHRENLECLKENLEVFGAENAVILEYWLDVSLFSKWVKPAVELEWHNEIFLSDIDTFAKLGAKNITTFAVMMDADYFERYSLKPIEDYGAGINSYRLK